MDSNQFKMFLDHQTQMLKELFQGIRQNAPNPVQLPPVPLPSPLMLDGDMEENFDFFEKSWNDYMKATKMDLWPVSDNPQRVSFLLSLIGEAAKKKFFNFELSEDERLTPEDALRAIREKVVPKRNIIVDRLDFFCATQYSCESIDDFTTRLKILAKVAKFGDLKDELITYKLVTANKWPQLRSKMLAVSEITLTKAVDICRAEEITVKRSQELVLPVSESEVNKVSSSKPGSSSRLPLCKFCGEHHNFSKGSCPALGKRCHRCQGRNHFEKVCKAKKNLRKKKHIKGIKNDASESEEDASQNESSSEECEDEYEIGKIYDNSNNGGSVLAELEVKIDTNWKKMVCELDTGANTSLVGYDYLCNLVDKHNLTLSPSKLRLQSFGGNPINVLGQVKLPCRRQRRNYRLVLQVVSGAHRPLLSAKVSQILGFVKFCKSVRLDDNNSSSSAKDLLNVYRVKAQKIVDNHMDLFVGYGKLEGKVTLEIDRTVTPSIQSPRRIPIALRSKLKEELGLLEKEGIITKESTHTDWVSNILIVQRNDSAKQSIRVCLDPVPLNKALKRPNLQFVTIDEILPLLGKAKVFTTVDTKKGFWHVVLDTPSSKLTTFWTPFGRYRWIRLPFGLASAPELFQMKLQQVIQGLDGVECIADDLLVYGTGDTLEEALIRHNECLEQLLRRLEERNVKLNHDKLKLCQTSVKFYGHVLTDKGLQADNSKISAIRNFPTPSNRKGVQRFIGMVNYLSRYIPSLSANLTHLRKLIKESQPWQWTRLEAAEFEHVKSLVADTRTLQYYDVKKPIIIECDASSFGLGVAVYQSNGVVGYASRTLTATERNYAQIEKELLAILFACIRFDQLIVGNPEAIVKTDHKPLLNIFNKPLLSAPRRLQHMLLNLQRYNLSINFVTGKENVVADALSRAPTEEDQPWDHYKKLCIYKVFDEIEKFNLSHFLSVSDRRLKEIIEETEKDPSMQIIIGYIQHGWPATIDHVPDSVRIYFCFRNEISTQNGIIFRGERIVVPHILRRKLIDCCHISHNGIEATLKLARTNLFWPGMNSQIKEVVKNCNVCAKFAASQPNPPMKSHIIPVHPFQIISMDVFYADYNGSKKIFLVTVDHYSDFFEVDMLRDLTPLSVIAACQKNFARHGKPQIVVCDNATNFVNKHMLNFSKTWDFELVTSAPHHQQANGKSEAAVKIAKRMLMKAKEDCTDFWYALLHWRNIPNKVGSSPTSRLFSRSTRCGIPSSVTNLLPKIVEHVPASIEENRKKTKYWYDKKTRNLPELQTGSPVYVQLAPETNKLWTPGRIAHRINDRSYTVDVNGREYRRSLVHLKPRNEPTTPSVFRTSDHPESTHGHPEYNSQSTELSISRTPSKDSQTPKRNSDGSPPAATSSRRSLPSSSDVQTIPMNIASTRPKRVTRRPEKLRDFVLE